MIPLQKYYELINRLYEKTIAGELEWKEAAISDAVQHFFLIIQFYCIKGCIHKHSMLCTRFLFMIMKENEQILFQILISTPNTPSGWPTCTRGLGSKLAVARRPLTRS
jgi:hypothetical protein